MSAEKAEKIVREIEIKPSILDNIKRDVQRSKAVTPQSLALKYNIRVSLARKLLRRFEKDGLVIYVDGNSRVRIYRGTKSKVKREG